MIHKNSIIIAIIKQQQQKLTNKELLTNQF